jgi:hypothetical protein
MKSLLHPKFNPSTGAWWKRVKERKVNRRSATDGKLKGPTCKASQEDKYMAKTSRSYKHVNYKAWRTKKKGA